MNMYNYNLLASNNFPSIKMIYLSDVMKSYYQSGTGIIQSKFSKPVLGNSALAISSRSRPQQQIDVFFGWPANISPQISLWLLFPLYLSIFSSFLSFFLSLSLCVSLSLFLVIPSLFNLSANPIEMESNNLTFLFESVITKASSTHVALNAPCST